LRIEPNKDIIININKNNTFLLGSFHIMFSLRVVSLLATVLRGLSADVERPHFSKITARVKQHRHFTGDLVEGEEELRKLILQWDKVLGAEQYEICHNCLQISDDSGEGDISDGKLLPIGVGRDHECGGNPCMVMPNISLGYNRFNIRVQSGGEWSPWSVHRNYNVDEAGRVKHEEL
jgi:hypothetical protein